jgi:hypothetical protein
MDKTTTKNGILYVVNGQTFESFADAFRALEAEIGPKEVQNLVNRMGEEHILTKIINEKHPSLTDDEIAHLYTKQIGIHEENKKIIYEHDIPEWFFVPLLGVAIKNAERAWNDITHSSVNRMSPKTLLN